MAVDLLLWTSFILLLAYLVGAIPFGYVVARARGVDIFRAGSGNIGATNVGRVLGRKYGILVFVLDFAKGAVPAAIAQHLATAAHFTSLPPGLLPVGAGLASFLGHLFPLYLGFRGGKGVATGAGVVAVLLPGPAFGALLTWAVIVTSTRYVSLASMVAAGALCSLRVLQHSEPFAADSRILTGFCFVAAGLVMLRHRSNIVRLLHGQENRLQDRATMRQFVKVLHLLSLGLWFGSGIFFTFVVALTLFQSFERLGEMPPAERPAWLPVSADFDKEKGTRLAGFAVAPIFPWYYYVQSVCGLLAAVTAAAFTRYVPAAKIHLLRVGVLVVALVTVPAGQALADKIGALRVERYASDPQIAELARASFGTWHGVSLLLNFFTLALVTAGMVLAAWLPPAEIEPTSKQKTK